MASTTKQIEQRRYERAVQANKRLEKKLLDAKEINRQVWRIKEMLDLIGDVLLAGEMPEEEIRGLYLQLGFVVDNFSIPSWLKPGRREVLGRAIVAEYRKVEKKYRIERIKGENQ